MLDYLKEFLLFMNLIVAFVGGQYEKFQENITIFEMKI